jgi:SAM-dependent methyltransferase
MTRPPKNATAPVFVRKLASGVRRVRSVLYSQRFGVPPSRIYDSKFYEEHVDANQQASAPAVVETLIELFSPRSVFDVGCGNGLYLGEFGKRDIEAFGCDGSMHAVEKVPATALAFQHDLRQPLRLNRTFELCTCFEVAEHIRKRYSANLVDTCAAVSNAIVFSSAPPGQGGTDHINEQPDSFWDTLFERRGVVPDLDRTQKLRESFSSRDVVSWLTDNIRVYRRN